MKRYVPLSLFVIIGLVSQTFAAQAPEGGWEGKVKIVSGEEYPVQIDIRHVPMNTIHNAYFLSRVRLGSTIDSIASAHFYYNRTLIIGIYQDSQKALTVPAEIVPPGYFPWSLQFDFELPSSSSGNPPSKLYGTVQYIFSNGTKELITHGQITLSRVAQTSLAWAGAIEWTEPAPDPTVPGGGQTTFDYALFRYPDDVVMAAMTTSTSTSASMSPAWGSAKGDEIIIGGESTYVAATKSWVNSCLKGKFVGSKFEGDVYERPHAHPGCEQKDLTGPVLGQYAASLFPVP